MIIKLYQHRSLMLLNILTGTVIFLSKLNTELLLIHY